MDEHVCRLDAHADDRREQQDHRVIGLFRVLLNSGRDDTARRGRLGTPAIQQCQQCRGLGSKLLQRLAVDPRNDTELDWLISMTAISVLS
jgi:hypothetical protein